MITVESLAGHVLEEILAALLRDNGYRLLVDKRQDEDALDEDHHGLVVKGRGANHQVDALGQLLFSVPFSLPIRLFAEAKCHTKPINIADLRNAVGVISDVNQRYTGDGTYQFPLRRFHYRYALFSTSGFTADAQKFALAHQISLIDLQGPGFSDLRVIARRTGRSLLRLARSAELKSFPLKQTREILRHALGTWSLDERDVGYSRRSSAHARDLLPEHELYIIGEELKAELTGKLLLGFPQGPFVLVLQPDRPEAFQEFLARSASQIDVDVKFASADGAVGEWAIVPRSDRGLIVRFGVPPLLESWLMTDGIIDHDRVEQVKDDLLSYIAVFHHGSNLAQLRYTKLAGARSDVDIFHPEGSGLRIELADANLAHWRHQRQSRNDWIVQEDIMLNQQVPAVAIKPSTYGRWTFESASELLQRLSRDRLSWQIDVIEEAAVTGGWLSRDRILQLSGDEHPNLGYFVKPVNSVVSELVAEGIIEEDATLPLRRVRSRGREVHYLIPPEFIEFLAPPQKVLQVAARVEKDVLLEIAQADAAVSARSCHQPRRS